MIDDVKEFLAIKNNDAYLQTREQQIIALAVIEQMGGPQRFLNIFQNLGGDSNHTGKWIESHRHVNIDQCPGFVITDEQIGLFEDNKEDMLLFLGQLAEIRGELSIVELLYTQMTDAGIVNLSRDEAARGLYQSIEPDSYPKASHWLPKATASKLAAAWTIKRFFAFMDNKYPTSDTELTKYLNARVNDGPYSFPLSLNLAIAIMKQFNRVIGRRTNGYDGFRHSYLDIVNQETPPTIEDIGFIGIRTAREFFDQHSYELLFFVERMGEREGLKSVIATLYEAVGSKDIFDDNLSEDDIAQAIYGNEDQHLSKKQEDLIAEILLRAAIFLCDDYSVYKRHTAHGKEWSVSKSVFTGTVSITGINADNEWHERDILDMFHVFRMIPELKPLKGLQVQLSDAFEDNGLRQGDHPITELIGVLGRDKSTYTGNERIVGAENVSVGYHDLSDPNEKSLLKYIAHLLIGFEEMSNGISINLSGDDKNSFVSGDYKLPDLIKILRYIIEWRYHTLY